MLFSREDRESRETLSHIYILCMDVDISDISDCVTAYWLLIAGGGARSSPRGGRRGDLLRGERRVAVGSVEVIALALLRLRHLGVLARRAGAARRARPRTWGLAGEEVLA